jgi:hypothetical protein
MPEAAASPAENRLQVQLPGRAEEDGPAGEDPRQDSAAGVHPAA